MFSGGRVSSVNPTEARAIEVIREAEAEVQASRTTDKAAPDSVVVQGGDAFAKFRTGSGGVGVAKMFAEHAPRAKGPAEALFEGMNMKGVGMDVQAEILVRLINKIFPANADNA